MRGKLAQRADRRLDEERRDAEADAVALLERLLAALAERHHGGHVHLVEGGEHRRGAAAPRPAGAQSSRAASTCARAPPCGRPSACRRSSATGGTGFAFAARRGRWRCRGTGGSGLLRGGSRLLDVAPHHAPAVAAAAHARQIDVVRFGSLLRRRRRARRARGFVLRFGGCRRCRWRRRRPLPPRRESPSTSPTFTSSPSCALDAAQHAGVRRR